MMFLSFILKCIQSNFQIGLVFSIIVICLICVYNTNYFRIMYYLSKIPGPKSYPIIGATYLCIGKTHAEISLLVMDVIKKFTPILSVNIGPIPLIIVTSPEYVQEVLNNYNMLEKPWLMTHIAVDIARNSILSAHVHKWKRNRIKIIRGFTPNILKTYFKVMVECSLTLANKLEVKLNNSKSFDILEYLSKASMDAIAKSTMGVNVNAQDNDSTAYNAVQSMFNITFARLYNPWQLIDPIFNSSKNFQRLTQAKDIILELAEKIIFEKRYQKSCISKSNNYSNENKIIDKDLFGNCLLDILLDATESDPLFDNKQLKEEIIVVIIAGFEATANVLSYTLLNLAVYKDIQDKVCEELFHVLGDTNRVIDFDDLPKLKYMEMVIKETMRLYTTVPVIGRKVTKDIKLDHYLIPKETTVIIPLFYLHRSEYQWENPLKFDPERFTPENMKNRHPYAYLPFSGGPRNCVGIRYGWIFMKIVLVTLLSRYEFHTDLNINKLRYKMELSLKLLGGHQIRITSRRKY